MCAPASVWSWLVLRIGCGPRPLGRSGSNFILPRTRCVCARCTCQMRCQLRSCRLGRGDLLGLGQFPPLIGGPHLNCSRICWIAWHCIWTSALHDVDSVSFGGVQSRKRSSQVGPESRYSGVIVVHYSGYWGPNCTTWWTPLCPALLFFLARSERLFNRQWYSRIESCLFWVCPIRVISLACVTFSRLGIPYDLSMLNLSPSLSGTKRMSLPASVHPIIFVHVNSAINREK